MNWYFKLLANHPITIILAIFTLSTAAFIVSITSTKLPDFSDPQLGFETRGTEIAKRLTAWKNLFEAARPSGILTVNPIDIYNPPPNISLEINPNLVNGPKIKTFNHSKKIDFSVSFIERERPELENDKNDSIDNISKTKHSFDVLSQKDQDSNHEIEDNYDGEHDHEHDHLSEDGFFCDGLSPEYAHIVLETTKPTQSLLSVEALHSICVIQDRLMNHEIVNSICQTVSDGHCCKPWSLPNYIKLLYNVTDCKNITEENVRKTKSLLFECSRYYNNLKLSSDCYKSSLCHGVPNRCKKFNSVYNMLYYLTDIDFLPANNTKLRRNHVFLNSTMIFLPIARSSDALPYYYNISTSDLKHNNVVVSAMDLGLKNAVFNDFLMQDAFLMIAGGIFMILCIWMYTKSLLITIGTLLAIIMSLITSYFIYTFIFKIKFFPFMNLLALIVAIGIGADDAFIFYKIWHCLNTDKTNSSIVKIVSDTLKHSSISMLMTSLTTAAAFYSSSVSSVTAINCFSIFAGTAVLANFFLMITWLPACFVVSEKNYFPSIFCNGNVAVFAQILRVKERTLKKIKTFMDDFLIVAVIRLKWLWLFLFSVIAVGFAVAVLYYPKLRLPDSRNFHLFQSSHIFERYDTSYREKFWFERLEKLTGWDNSNFKLPLRFVWGLYAIDNGNYLEPNSKGSLEFDNSFDMASPESQEWLLNFCHLLRAQPFYQSTPGPLLPNCFIESFKNWMLRRCRDTIDNIDRTPCCESSKFPYSREVFSNCIVKAISSLYETPADYFLPGVAGPKFSKTKREHIMVVVVEYDSNQSYSMSFSDMHNFYSEVEAWFQEQLMKAPPGMKNGWFISQLEFYDLQLALSSGTSVAIGVSMVTAFAVFFLVSLNLVISIYTMLTISFIIFVTVGLLVFLGWSLNVVESIAVTTAIGLAVDFSLHYGINYGLFVENCQKMAVVVTLKRMGGPTLMAALTTGAAGFFMLPSSVLAYIQIGVFLLVVMATSWLYSTIFLMALLSAFGPRKGFCQFSYKSMFSFLHSKGVTSPSQRNKTVCGNILTDSLLSTSSVTERSSFRVASDEIHEMEALNNENKHSSMSAKVILKTMSSP